MKILNGLARMRMMLVLRELELTEEEVTFLMFWRLHSCYSYETAEVITNFFGVVSMQSLDVILFFWSPET